ncbi:ATP-grasp domain-containing protein [Candidatus Leptofilum sp.]|uniref:ATP-grasp domain-containing protein n=1 Tax=Candidatus Leptofilum sp. TaxID=3241576 RepID=UPI003B58FBEF
MSANEKTVLLLTTPQSYRADAFVSAARQLGIALVVGVDLPESLAAQWGVQLHLDFSQPETAVTHIIEFAKKRPLAAIIPVDDAGAVLAARASRELGLPHNNVAAAEAARDKHQMRQMLAAAGVNSPKFKRFSLDDPLSEMNAQVLAEIGFPCVVKPLYLNGSRGVMRANDATELAAVVSRLRGMLPSGADFLVESYLPGVEVALEGVLENGRLHPLAIFDKPDPLEGPFFEETIYMTPSCLPDEVQQQIVETAAAGAAALGLQLGSVHAELRVNEAGAWIVEVNGRSIGGLCSQTLRFDMGLSLEELILRQATGLPVSHLQREQQASGVMMIPIPHGGILRGVRGVAAAQAIPGVDEVTITAPLNNRLVPLPEGESYLGFIFATGNAPAEVENALRQAHAQLNFQIDEEIRLAVIGNQ